MISCFFRSPLLRDPCQGGEGGLHVRAGTDDQIVISVHLTATAPHLFCSLTPDDARALADALYAGADLATASTPS